MPLRWKWRLILALVGVVLWTHPGMSAKIDRFTDKEGTLHISNSGEAEPGKPGGAPPAAPIGTLPPQQIFPPGPPPLPPESIEPSPSEPPPLPPGEIEPAPEMPGPERGEEPGSAVQPAPGAPLAHASSQQPPDPRASQRKWRGLTPQRPQYHNLPPALEDNN